MKIYLADETLKRIKEAGAKSPVFREAYRYSREVDDRTIVPTDFPIIAEALKNGSSEQDKKSLKKLELILSLRMSGGKGKITKLEALPEAVRQVMMAVPHHWVFTEHSVFNVALPWLVVGAEYHPPVSRGDDYTPASVEINVESAQRGHEESRRISIYTSDMREGATVEGILRLKEWVVETPALVADYERSMVAYDREYSKTGEQYTGTGTAIGNEDRWSHDDVSLEVDGESSKLIMDDLVERGDKSTGTSGTTFYADKVRDEESDDDERETPKNATQKVMTLPVHPIVRMFHLGTHGFVLCHIDSVKPYEYDPETTKKLVMPEGSRILIDTLTSGAIRKMQDIVRGKALGVMILCSGPPGTGKTTTAEVYAEAAQRPLYAVACSQLGTDEEKLEKSLSVVLSRATRWRAILLIDEADVYIHERGSDIQQNAIVGIFLRLLEYYKGILFLTTNRETIVDDAILSRMTAVVRYQLPKRNDALALWSILSKQLGVSIVPREAQEQFPGASGRMIRQLLRLAQVLADRRKEKITTSHLIEVSAFIHGADEARTVGQEN